MIVKGYLIVRADGSTRTVTRTPLLGMDEFAFRLTVKLPDAWGQVLGAIDVEVPESVVPTITIDLPPPASEEPS